MNGRLGKGSVEGYVFYTCLLLYKSIYNFCLKDSWNAGNILISFTYPSFTQHFQKAMPRECSAPLCAIDDSGGIFMLFSCPSDFKMHSKWQAQTESFSSSTTTSACLDNEINLCEVRRVFCFALMFSLQEKINFCFLVSASFWWIMLG